MAMANSQARLLQRELEEELGGAGVYSLPLQVRALNLTLTLTLIPSLTPAGKSIRLRHLLNGRAVLCTVLTLIVPPLW